jgi:hypothetical protein
MASLSLPLSRAGFTPKVLAELGWAGRAGDMMAEVNGQGMLAWALDKGRYKLAALLCAESIEAVSHAGLAALAPGIDLSHVLDDDTTLPHLLLDLGAKPENPGKAGALGWAIIVHGKKSDNTRSMMPPETPEAWEALIHRLIDCGAQLNSSKDRTQDPTLLCLAALHSPSLIPLLVERGADLDWTNKNAQPYEAWVSPEALGYFHLARASQEKKRLEASLDPAVGKAPASPRL